MHRAGGRGGVVQAVDVDSVVELAAKHDVVVELVPAVGAFVMAGGPLFRVHGESQRLHDHLLRSSILFGEERTAHQDPQLAFRILVDIAIRALSPAINDPTTCVESLDRIGDLLVALAGRTLPDGVHRDRSGGVRFVEPVPTWDDYLDLAFTEIRLYGAGSPFVARAMRRILDDLDGVASPLQRPSVDHQRDLLDRALASPRGE